MPCPWADCLTDLHGPEGLADLLRDVEEEVLDLLVLQPARRQQAPSQTAEVGLHLVASPGRHLLRIYIVGVQKLQSQLSQAIDVA